MDTIIPLMQHSMVGYHTAIELVLKRKDNDEVDG